jgi:hypothetical protein
MNAYKNAANAYKKTNPEGTSADSFEAGSDAMSSWALADGQLLFPRSIKLSSFSFRLATSGRRPIGRRRCVLCCALRGGADFRLRVSTRRTASTLRKPETALFVPEIGTSKKTPTRELVLA